MTAKPLYFLLWVSIGAQASVYSCLRALNPQRLAIFKSAAQRETAATLAQFVKRPSGLIPLTVGQIAELPVANAGELQTVFVIPGTNDVVKLPSWRSHTTDKGIRDATRSDRRKQFTESVFPDLFAPTQYAISLDGLPVNTQKVVKTSGPMGRAILDAFYDRVDEEYPGAKIDRSRMPGSITFRHKDQIIVIHDLRPANVGVYNGNPVILDYFVNITAMDPVPRPLRPAIPALIHP